MHNYTIHDADVRCMTTDNQSKEKQWGDMFSEIQNVAREIVVHQVGSGYMGTQMTLYHSSLDYID